LPSGERFGSAARNFYRLLRDVDVSSFDYVAFADQDDIWLPDKLLRATQVLAKGYMGYSSNVLAFWPDGKECLIKKAQPQRDWDFLFESPGPGCSFVLQRELVLTIQQTLPSYWSLLQEINYHDWFVYAFARARRLPWFIDGYAGVRYRQHAHNELGANAGLNAFWARMVRVVGGSGFRQAATLAKVVGLNDDPFVRAWAGGQRFGFCKLALMANQCRRRKRDRFFFLILCIKRCLVGDSGSR
jgi:rhamnosyltransferase